MVSVGILLLFFLEPAVWMIRNHPHQTFYFSPLIGGVNGAFKKYEIDYWGMSFRPAVEWIAAQKLPSEDNQIIRIRAPYGMRPSSEHFIDKYNHLVYVETPEESPDWDYSLILPAMAKFQPELLTQWPPQGTVHEIKVDNTPLVAIVKNYRTVSYMQSIVQRAIQAAAKNKSPENYLNLSVRYYEAGQYEKCIEAAQEALKLKPDFASAYNNICSAYNEMKMSDKAIEACHQALAIEPEFQLAKNNLESALEKKHLMHGK
jgi:tetratricopeptide (TPR) repeat protein